MEFDSGVGPTCLMIQTVFRYSDLGFSLLVSSDIFIAYSRIFIPTFSGEGYKSRTFNHFILENPWVFQSYMCIQIA